MDGHHDETGRGYDTVAADYAAHFAHELDHKPLDRALLTALLDEAAGDLPVADLGCGPGHVGAFLARRGARAVGIDLSAGMVAIGRKLFPEVEFRRGDLLRLPAGDGEFGAAVAFYSIIHLAPGELGAAFTEMHRVLSPRAPLLVSFHVGSEVRHLSEWWGKEVDIDFRFFEMDEVVAATRSAGFTVSARLLRVAYPGEVETTRGYLLAR